MSFWWLATVLMLVAIVLAVWPLRRLKVPALFIAVLMPLMVGVFYRQLGAMPEMVVAEVMSNSQTSEQEAEAALMQWRDARPDNLQAKFLLSQQLAKQGKTGQAIEVLRQALQSHEVHPQITSTLAQLLFSQHQVITLEVRMLYKQTLKMQPDNMIGMQLQSLDAYDQKDYQLATDTWQNMLDTLALDLQMRQSILFDMDQAKRALGLPVANIAVRIEKVPQLIVPDEAKVVIVARDQELIIAMVVAKAFELPETFVLDDSTTLMRDQLLSTRKTVNVEAHIVVDEKQPSLNYKQKLQNVSVFSSKPLVFSFK